MATNFRAKAIRSGSYVSSSLGSAPVEDGGELPGEVHGVADAGVHPLAADRAVDVGGVSQQERASFPELRRHPVVDVIGREPVRPVDRELEVPGHALPDVLEGQFGMLFGRAFNDGPHESHPARLLQWEDEQEVLPGEIAVHLPVHRGAGAFHVGDEEDVIVGAARESNPQASLTVECAPSQPAR